MGRCDACPLRHVHYAGGGQIGGRDACPLRLNAARIMALPATYDAFDLDPDTLQARYFELFDAIRTEIRSAKPGSTT